MTTIEWTRSDDGSAGKTLNVFVGCSLKSAGCQNCYAMKLAHRGLAPSHRGLTVMNSKGPHWTGEVRFVPAALVKPLRWRKPRRIFVNSLSDTFHESNSFEHIAALFGVMAATPQHTYQLLTKRPQRMREWFDWVQHHELGCPISNIGNAAAFALAALSDDGSSFPESIAEVSRMAWPLPNVWLGVSAENQPTADERIPLLLQTPAAVRFVSAEPLLGPVSFSGLPANVGNTDPETNISDWFNALTGHGINPEGWTDNLFPTIDWVIVGGESGPGARACDMSWIRSIVEQCAEAGTAVFCKQMGSSWARNAGADAKGGDVQFWPEGAWPREFPNV